MRGTPVYTGTQYQFQRFIPAHAGNTKHAGSPSRFLSGSSPRMRGTLETQLDHVAQQRFIPAHAGNTPIHTIPNRGKSVHPRACGEHAVPVPIKCRPVRFIPAHAGNTLARAFLRRSATVHPRACGEHQIFNALIDTGTGSSPRMRGTLPSSTETAARIRFIPAHAGNTDATGTARRPPPVHPRACGEHRLLLATEPTAPGSSPRMRGTHAKLEELKRENRFIPAHAGNTFEQFDNGVDAAVHPRACGEHCGARTGFAGDVRFIPAHAGNTFGNTKHGNPIPVHPRACGEHLGAGIADQAIGRFIPAHAGNTRYRRAPRRCWPVHPRACGEHRASNACPTCMHGSSPRMRGTHRLRRVGGV